MRGCGQKVGGLTLLLAIVLVCSCTGSCEAKRSRRWRAKRASSHSPAMQHNDSAGFQPNLSSNPPLSIGDAGGGFQSRSSQSLDLGFHLPKIWSRQATPGQGNGNTGGNGSPNIPSIPMPSPTTSNGNGYPSPNAPSPSSSSSLGKGHPFLTIPPALMPPHFIPKIQPAPSWSRGRSHSRGYPPPPQQMPTPPSPKANIFNVLAYGAKGDGATDDTKAFETAWSAACKIEASTVFVPANKQFLVGPISFSGPYCAKNIVFQLEGTIIAPTSAKAWGSGLLQWLEFTKLVGITIQGSGAIEGKGSVWWTISDINDQQMREETSVKMPRIKPTALRFYGSINVTVTGITIQNSPQCHLKFDSCIGVSVHNVTISSPANSINTDGIHLQNSKDVAIHHSSMACGDDCVSIQTGCTNINIQNVNCGPGHGISIGGLGRDNTKACVSNVTVRDIDMQNTMAGVRIKTWQGGSGLVQNIRFSNIRVSNVQTPIIIDQFYCDQTTCKNQTAAVAVSGVHYENIRGTYTVKPVHLACSDNSPCSEITLTGVDLRPGVEQCHMYEAFCWHAYGQLFTPTIPPIPCLLIGKPERNNILSDHDTC